MNRLDIGHTKDPKKWRQDEVEEHTAALCGDNICYYCRADLKAEKLSSPEHQNHDHTATDECLEVEYTSAAERFDKGEAIAHMTQDEQQEYIRTVNNNNRKRVAESNKAPF